MPRLISLFIIGFLILSAVIAAAQPEIPSFIPIEPAPPEPFTYTVPLQSATWEEVVANLSQAPEAGPPSDTCIAAPTLNLSLPADGGQAIVNNYTEDPADPILGCAWGNPPRPQGYRTAWYKVTPPTGGMLVVEALPNADYRDNYDTIIAIHHAAPPGDCQNLQTLTCNDDYNGFLSRASVIVQQGETYYIEIADWQFGINGTARLNVLAYITQAETFWEQASNLPTPLSRHSAVRVGDDFYIFGGVTSTGSAPERTNASRKFNTVTRQWSILKPMPAAGSTCLDVNGYAATDAAYLNGRIFIPTGYAGNNNQYCDVHRIYDIASNTWSIGPTGPWPAALGWSQMVEYPPLNGYFVVGGLTGAPLTANANPSANIYLYLDDGGGTWFGGSLPAMNQARYGHAAARLGNRICVIGGINASNQIIAGGECYNIDLSSWGAIPALQYPRFNAGSAVGPDGRWYVFGGTSATLSSVAPVEVFDPATNTWQLLDARHNLGTSSGFDRPARSWVRGDFVGRSLWVFGGEQDTGVFNNGNTLSLVERLTNGPLWPYHLNLPVLRSPSIVGEPNDTFAQAQDIPVHQTLAFNFESQEDYHDVYRFYQPGIGGALFYLQNIPNGADYDLLLYSGNKTLLGSSRNIGNLDEYLEIILGPGYYYIMVVRAFPLTTPPPPDYYTLRVEN
ncbi:MAG: hypothetical protein KJ063_20165 [Anaerolineae bacterium]|nr:hypothetical protein [Anaerolineae bacterium]